MNGKQSTASLLAIGLALFTSTLTGRSSVRDSEQPDDLRDLKTAYYAIICAGSVRDWDFVFDHCSESFQEHASLTNWLVVSFQNPNRADELDRYVDQEKLERKMKEAKISEPVDDVHDIDGLFVDCITDPRAMFVEGHKMSEGVISWSQAPPAIPTFAINGDSASVKIVTSRTSKRVPEDSVIISWSFVRKDSKWLLDKYFKSDK